MSYRFYKKTFFCACLTLFVVAKGFSSSVPLDSVGMERLGNKLFIVHRVDPKETLFSLSKKYNVKVEVLEIENPELREGMKIGQLLRIPYQPPQTTQQNPSNQRAKVKTHVVEHGQTLYAISRIYKVSVEDIMKWNNLTSNELNVGQEIIVNPEGQLAVQSPPTSDNSVKTQKEVSAVQTDSNGNKTHIAESGQTLYSISRIYNVTVEELKNWNQLVSNDISTGQELIVTKPKTAPNVHMVEQKQKPVEETIVIKQDSQKSATSANIEFTPAVSSPKADSPKNSVNTNTTTPSVANSPKESSGTSFNKIIERGLAESIEESGDNPKFLALHRTASPGTIIQVKNELNNLYIFARVIGKLPATGSNDKLVVKLSKKAYDKLGAVDRRFPVEVSYVPQ